jgi:hypothetical protein
VLEQIEEAFDEVAFKISTKAHTCGALRSTLGGMSGVTMGCECAASSAMSLALRLA